VNAAHCQYAGERCGEMLPFTGYALVAVLVIGVALVIAGLVVRR